MTIIFFETKIRFATKINKNQGLVLKTIGVNFVVNYSYLAIRLERSAHSLYSFSRTSIQDLPFVLALAFGKQVAKTIARDIRRLLPPLSPRSHELRGGPIGAACCIGGQNK